MTDFSTFLFYILVVGCVQSDDGTFFSLQSPQQTERMLESVETLGKMFAENLDGYSADTKFETKTVTNAYKRMHRIGD